MHIRALWEEFDAAESNDAKYANCLDRLQPFFHNMLTEGHTCRNSDFPTNSILVRKRMAVVGEFMPEIHSWIEKNLDFAIENQWLKEK
jgi:putative hydrolase of HD superfamily